MTIASWVSYGMAICAVTLAQCVVAIPNGSHDLYLAHRDKVDDSPLANTTTILRTSTNAVPKASPTTPLAPDVPFSRLTVNYTRTFEKTDTETTWLTVTSAVLTEVTSTEIFTSTQVTTAAETHVATVTQTEAVTSTRYVQVTLTATAVPVTERFSETYTYFETIFLNVTSVIFQTMPMTSAANSSTSANVTAAPTTTTAIATPLWANTTTPSSSNRAGTNCAATTVTETQTHTATIITVESTSSEECLPVTQTVVSTSTTDTTSTVTVTATTTETPTETVSSTVIVTDTTTEVATSPATTTEAVFTTVRTTTVVNLTRISISTSTVEFTRTVNVTETVSGGSALGGAVGCSPTISDSPLTSSLHRNPSPTVYPRPPASTDSESQPQFPSLSTPAKSAEPTDEPGDGDGPEDN